MLLHKRRVTEGMCRGEEQANLSLHCYNCLVKATTEMPVNALANGRWLGRHPEIMRSMPYGHRLLLPVRRVIFTKVIFTDNPKREWERSHSQKGLHGVTVVVEQDDASSSILEVTSAIQSKRYTSHVLDKPMFVARLCAHKAVSIFRSRYAPCKLETSFWPASVTRLCGPATYVPLC